MQTERRARLLPLALALSAIVVGIAAGFPLLTKDAGATRTTRRVSAESSPTPASAAMAPAPKAEADVVNVPQLKVTPPAPAPVAKAAPAPARTAPATTPKPNPGPKSAPPAPKGPSVDAYRGLAAWVDIYDSRAYEDPSATVRDMKAHGVKTLFLETANSRSQTSVVNETAVGTFIRAAHGSGMSVVAWYLPDLTDLRLDFSRIQSAIGFRTSDGQRFDSFALDIESPAVASEGARNANLTVLSQRIRGLVGPKYPLGAIIPSPAALANAGSYWHDFPYGMLSNNYDVYVPMSYYTYHGSGGPQAMRDTMANVSVLRKQPGAANKPIHLIGGLAEGSSPSEVRAFLQATNKTGCIGAGLYEWNGTTPDHWSQLSALAPRP